MGHRSLHRDYFLLGPAKADLEIKQSKAQKGNAQIGTEMWFEKTGVVLSP